jgi:hypothetical protein
MLKVEKLGWDDLPQTERDRYGRWSDRQYGTFLQIEHGDFSRIYSDTMEPEDARFFRDLSWVEHEIRRAYNFGIQDERERQTDKAGPKMWLIICDNPTTRMTSQYVYLDRDDLDGTQVIEMFRTYDTYSGDDDKITVVPLFTGPLVLLRIENIDQGKELSDVQGSYR